MSRKATATVLVTIEYDVDQTFDNGVSINNMREYWDEWINLVVITASITS